MNTTPKPPAPLTAADLMTRDVVTVPQQLPAADAAQVLLARSISGVPVVDDRGRCVGVFSATDFARLAETGFRPEALLSSTALRARTTADAFAAALATTVTLVPDLYGAPPSTLLAVASQSGRRRVMLVAHNPGMTELAEALSGGGIGEMPTCAVARFRWDDDDWAVVGAVDGALLLLVGSARAFRTRLASLNVHLPLFLRGCEAGSTGLLIGSPWDGMRGKRDFLGGVRARPPVRLLGSCPQ